MAEPSWRTKLHRPRVRHGRIADSASTTSSRSGSQTTSFRARKVTETRPTRSFVAVGQWMIPRHATCKYGCLVDQVWVEVLTAEAGLRGMKCRVGEVMTSGLAQNFGIDFGNLLGEPPELARVMNRVPGKPVEQLLISLEELADSGRELLISSNPGDLCRERLDDERIDTDAIDACNRFRLLSQILWQSYSGLLSHDIMISRCRMERRTGEQGPVRLRSVA